jgi:HK97 family phage prohead protease
VKVVAPKVAQGTRERREFALTDVEVRKAPEGSKSPGGFRGYAAVYDSLSVNLGGFREKIDPGTFDTAIAEDDVRALFNHDRNHVLGRSKAGDGTMRLSSDDKGLLVEIDELPNTSTARDLVELLKRGDVDQMSFGFTTVRDRWEEDEDGRVIRTLEEVRLFDVSPVTFPAYPDTEAEARGESIVIRLPEEIRAGKVLSARSRTLVEQARDALADLLSHADGENAAPADAVEGRDENEAATDARIRLARARIAAMALGDDPRDVVI